MAASKHHDGGRGTSDGDGALLYEVANILLLDVDVFIHLVVMPLITRKM
jgi:hypothetical protein